MRHLGLAPLALALLASCSDSGRPTDPLPLAAEVSRAAAADADHDLTLEGVALPSGATVDLHVRVYENERAGECSAAGTVFALHGFAHTAATWEPLAQALFTGASSGACRVLALDLPGRGGAPTPLGSFSDITLQDYAAAVLSALARLRDEEGLVASTLIGHSQGALILQMAQQELVAGGSSLREAHAAERVVLLAPVPPGGLPWAAADLGVVGGLLGGFGAFDPALGVHFAIPAAAWPSLFFSDPRGWTPPGTPSPGEVEARGYNAPEPLASAVQLGTPALRPAVSAGIFAAARGTRLTVVAFESDAFVRPEEAAAVSVHLTGGESGGAIHTVGGRVAVHDTYVSAPMALRHLLR